MHTPSTRPDRGPRRSTRDAATKSASHQRSGSSSAKPGRRSDDGQRNRGDRRHATVQTHEARAQRARADIDGQDELVCHPRIMKSRRVKLRANMTAPVATIAAIATPPGRGGIGIVRVSGGEIEALIQGIAGRVPPPRVATLADFRDAQGGVIDQGLVLHFPAPHSYTGEDGRRVSRSRRARRCMRLLLARCVELGARIAEPGEFTKRAFLNGKLDLAQAESVADLIDAATATAARAAARSLAGEFSRDIHALVDALTELRVYTEATLDFPDEDIEFLRDGDVEARLRALRADLARVLDRARTGALLREGLASCWSAGRTSASRAF